MELGEKGVVVVIWRLLIFNCDNETTKLTIDNTCKKMYFNHVLILYVNTKIPTVTYT